MSTLSEKTIISDLELKENVPSNKVYGHTGCVHHTKNVKINNGDFEDFTVEDSSIFKSFFTSKSIDGCQSSEDTNDINVQADNVMDIQSLTSHGACNQPDSSESLHSMKSATKIELVKENENEDAEKITLNHNSLPYQYKQNASQLFANHDECEHNCIPKPNHTEVHAIEKEKQINHIEYLEVEESSGETKSIENSVKDLAQNIVVNGSNTSKTTFACTEKTGLLTRDLHDDMNSYTQEKIKDFGYNEFNNNGKSTSKLGTSKEYFENLPMYKVNSSSNDSDSESSKKKEVDPFTLSADEDFSPKAYKPIKRKQSQGFIDFKNHYKDTSNDLNFFKDLTDVAKEKRQKLTNENLSTHNTLRVAYVYSKELVDKANKLIKIEGRANLVHSLIEVYGIQQHVQNFSPRLATEAEILGFHCSAYIDFLKGLTNSEDLSDSMVHEAETYGLSYDCPLQDNVFETASLISGATITAAETLITGTASIAINWCGGWHHAKRDSASGFCYINDIVLGILKLRERFDKVLYVDLDLHHGDGVEEAFYTTPKVMTVSFHKYGCGFFPGSGSLDDIGLGRGKLYSVNVPLHDGVRDAQFYSIFTSVMKKVREKFQGEAIVIQCGADSLSGDPMASFNLTHVAIAKCVCFLLTWNLPTLLLGGGGYNFPNTAICWTFITAMAAGKKLPVDIPEHEHLLEYGPSFELTTYQGNRKDCNTKEHFYQIMSKISKNLNSL